ncbi:hypothetical protein [Flavihumibacter petaseus]|uniref:Uncharacterized protein n=1 Tax=Flavihumibacter petaseus NBRC 106054 TaxID=1220578 RepID=A0A0E9N2N8_9BACT|nr:hypothetical protein [Flavihumibacter petaseus]GAO44109.1 hypothetical protein FPE01S_03_01480 [Flavihumibacter petaseus NBRC 106054]
MPPLLKVIPVNPLLNDTGEFISLKQYTNSPRPDALQYATGAPSYFGEEYRYNLSTSSKLEIAAIGGIEASHGTTTFIHDSIVYKLSRDPNQNSDLIKGTWWGYGLRLTIVIKNAEFGLNINWGAVAAAAQLGYLDAEFNIDCIGISDSVLFDLLPAPIDLNIKSYKEILAIGDQIRAFAVKKDPVGVIYKPLRIQVPSETSIDPIADDRTLIFVYQQVGERASIVDALKTAAGLGLNTSLIPKYYQEKFQITNVDDRPSPSDKRKARDWLDM